MLALADRTAPVTFPYEPPLQLAGTPIIFIRSIDDATGILREYVGGRPRTRDLILRRLNAASTKQETVEAAKTFRWWAEQGKPFAGGQSKKDCCSR